MEKQSKNCYVFFKVLSYLPNKILINCIILSEYTNTKDDTSIFQI